MKVKTFGETCVFEGEINRSKLQKLVVIKSGMDEAGWEDPPFDASGSWISIAKAKKLVRDLNKAIAYADKSKVGT